MLLLSIFVAQLGLPFSMFTGGPEPIGTPTPTPTPVQTQVSTPTISGSGANTPLVVTITCATGGATIFYTISSPPGTTPGHNGGSPTGSTLTYTGPFNTGTGNKTVKALGYKAGLTDSAIASADFFRDIGGGQ